MESKPQTLFLDTNILLHYKPLDQIDWLQLTRANKVHLAVCMPVIHELDRKKSDPRLGERAARAISHLEKWHSNEGAVREGVQLELHSNELVREDFPPGMSPDQWMMRSFFMRSSTIKHNKAC